MDHRPGVLTKGFCTLPHEQEQQEQDGWQLDQPEEDELSCDSFIRLPGGMPASKDLPHSTSSLCNKSSKTDDGSPSETLHGEICRAQAADGHVANLLSHSRPPSASSPPLPTSLELNGHMDLTDLQVSHSSTMERAPGEGALG